MSIASAQRTQSRVEEGEDPDGGFRVLVAGAGIGGLEGILALRGISGSGLQIEMLSPEATYRLAPLSVLEPFTETTPTEISLADFCDDHSVELTLDGLAEVWPEQQRVLTDSGSELYYDALLVSMGARRQPVSPGTFSFRGSADVDGMIQRLRGVTHSGGRVAFVVPKEVDWTLPLYELALMTADQLRSAPVTIEFLTSEPRPLAAFGESASELAAELLAAADVRVRTGLSDPVASAGELKADELISLPMLTVPEIAGVPQHRGGFIPVDPEMRVPGAQGVWAVGDVTWSPLKQGGLAAQQADVAAASIAAAAGFEIEVPPYVPVLRAALMTADGPYYLRSGTPDSDGELRAPLWWPPAKVAGRLLAPYLARRMGAAADDRELVDLPVTERRAEDHQEACELALRWADVDAASGDFKRALHWLDVAEGLDLTLPAIYERRREQWRRSVRSG